MNEYNIQDLMILGVTIQEVIDDMLKHPENDAPTNVIMSGIQAHHNCVQMILELQKAHASKFTNLPIVDTEVKTDGIEQ